MEIPLRYLLDVPKARRAYAGRGTQTVGVAAIVSRQLL
jgi:hypothetical protein